MFYAKLDKEFDIKQTQQDHKKPQRPPSTKKANNPVLKEAGYNAVQLDKQTANAILKDLNVPPIQDALDHQIRNSSPRLRNPSPKKSDDLLTNMAARLQKVEKLNQSLKLELKEKTELAITLKDQLDEARKYKNSTQEQNIAEIESLKEEKGKLEKKVKMMESFLLEYGMKWVDDKCKGDPEKLKQLARDLQQPKPVYNYHLPTEISIDQIKRRVDELNYIMEKEGATEIVKDPNGMHKIRRMDPVPIGFYKNGIALKGFKFFPYGGKDAQQILADILDGYFPYQLKKQYPDGILLKVMEKTDQTFDSEKLLNNKQMDIHQWDEHQFKPQSKDEFLEKLPKNVIKDGKIIPIRSEIEKKLEGKPQEKDGHERDEEGNIVVMTKMQRERRNGAQIDEGELCTLKLRTETGQKTLIAVMHAKDTIRDLYDAVRDFREDKSKKVEILQNFPRMTFSEQDQQTLEDAGLCPNAQLFFK